MAKKKKRRPYQQQQAPARPPRRAERERAPRAPARSSGRRRWLLAAVAAAAVLGIVLAVVLTQRSGDGRSASPTSTTAPIPSSRATSTRATATTVTHRPPTAKLLFGVYCGVCHTLRDAGAIGDSGPDLDRLKPSRARVLRAIRIGGTGTGNMPEEIFRGRNARRVAAYVARATRKP